MCFSGALYHIVWKILTTDPAVGPVYIRKVDLDDAYMHHWESMETTTSTVFLLPELDPADKQLVLFQLSLHMEYVESKPYFCMATETVTDLDNQCIPVRHTATGTRPGARPEVGTSPAGPTIGGPGNSGRLPGRFRFHLPGWPLQVSIDALAPLPYH